MNITNKLLKKFSMIEDLLGDLLCCSDSTKLLILETIKKCLDDLKNEFASVNRRIGEATPEIKQLMAEFNFYDPDDTTYVNNMRNAILNRTLVDDFDDSSELDNDSSKDSLTCSNECDKHGDVKQNSVKKTKSRKSGLKKSKTGN